MTKPKHPPLQPVVIRPALRAFWHKSRKVTVPLTSSEWVARTGLDPSLLPRLCQANMLRMVTEKKQRKGDPRIYELTDAGAGRLVMGA